MIQRIQSIWLLLAGVTICCLLFIPMVTATAGNTEYYINANGLYQKLDGVSTLLKGSIHLLIMTIAVAVMCLINVFNYKNRTSQKRIAYINIVFIIALSFWCSIFAKKIPGGLETANYNIGMFLPVIAIFFCILAIRGINNDEKLLRSADRLR
ncbi:DUF4293 family protein [Pedobacter sp. LMG 31464]|uniref:DUF4293 family protein n=1 Tax=Pedobacter planticolens TaxID=2679964 RepID=A0A923E2I9_9SPHI|nr:DUF4293 domain-containing protein [Pedobacter planticolens]MBB2147050.1 DUF4293 family protein [Pedobacter planticolens]